MCKLGNNNKNINKTTKKKKGVGEANPSQFTARAGI
jgi:hypothetical protein